MTRTRHVVGNWKQNLLRPAAAALVQEIHRDLTRDPPENVQVSVAPSFLALDAVREALTPASPVHVFAQDCAASDVGPFTGEVGPPMLAEAGVTGAIVGHSERRAHFGDTDDLVARKLAHSLRAGFHTILCVGESLAHRRAGDHEKVVMSQLYAALQNLHPSLWTDRFILAYEPVWAIGTGETATPDQAARMHRSIRKVLREIRSDGDDRSILYGGSVKPTNAADLLAAGDMDGFLVGGASLDASAFLAIVRTLANP